VLTEADVEETGMEVDGVPQLKYFKQLVIYIFDVWD